MTAWGPPWCLPPAMVQLGQDEVHLWTADLTTPRRALASYLPDLDAEEERRAARFVFPKHKRRFILAHVMMRSVLARYLNCAPAALNFTADAYGKPKLAGPQVDAVQFNLTHSHERAVLAVSQATPLGVDIEWTKAEQGKPMAHWLQFAERFFSLAECQALKGLPEGEQLAGFYRTWTRKEAFVKLLGVGLQYPLDQFTVSVADTNAQALLAAQANADVPATWSNLTASCHLSSYATGAGYQGAIAMAGPARTQVTYVFDFVGAHNRI